MAGVQGRAVQVAPIKPTPKAPGTNRLKLNPDELLLKFAFKFSLRRYIKVVRVDIQRMGRQGFLKWAWRTP